MDIQFQNTLSGTKELFTPLKKNEVGMYHCGPTVYNYPHIGNLRAYVFADTLKRLFLYAGYRVNQVINITDVGHLVSDADDGEDKVEKMALEQKKTAHEIATFYTDVFFANLRSLNIDTRGTHFPRASEHVPEQIRMIETLEKKGFTYRTSDGIYFDTSKFPRYGELGHIDIKGLREGERIGVNDEKKNLTDFALWKFSPKTTGKNEKRQQEWQSPWGVGFPGWHIECSAMSMKYLGETFDIHTGGIDHIPVHHQNEIAQSESATRKPFVHYWMHSAFMNIEGGKMAKSKDNFLTLDELVKKGFFPLAYRFLLLSARYSTPLSFTEVSMEAAQRGYDNLRRLTEKLAPIEEVESNSSYRTKIEEFIADDLNTAGILALIPEILGNSSLRPGEKRHLLGIIDSLTGLELLKKPDETPLEIQSLVTLRETAKVEKDWKKADSLREKIRSLGYEVMDTKTGQEVRKI
jgi:cysteinyl-tRNA synthetase